ncbi:uncharacterized protein LOC132700090 [Cylas formicarius]|uniref:uncharacterized protein LOC132700090 n=1 Tax=Cylas formicarius TaxID=197179 RepID=UPI00295884A3|nr:uncharacterized protein LOC132700090 [Cylas formicarius]
MLARLIGIPSRVEALIIILLGIFSLSLDMSPLYLISNLKSISDVKLERAPHLEDFVKYILRFIVIARSSTHHLFLVCYALMIWPAIFEEKPNLMLPWLFLGILRCLLLNFIAFLAGSFVCHKERGLQPVCLDFLLAQVVDHAPSVYAWFSMLSYYRELSEFSHQLSFDDLWQKTRAKSLSICHLDVDVLELERVKIRFQEPGGVLFNQIRLLVDNAKQASSRSFDSLVNQMQQREENPLDIFEFIEGSDMCAKMKAMRVLGVTEDDVARIGTGGGRMSKTLEEIGVDDLSTIEASVKGESFYIKKGETYLTSKSDHLKSIPALGDVDRREICRCLIKRGFLRRDSSNEREIVSVHFDSK